VNIVSGGIVFYGWWIVFACAVALATGVTSLMGFTLGIFMGPFESEFGWTRTEVTFGLTLATIVGLFVAPVAGRLADRFGVRRLALSSLLLQGLGVASLSMLQGDIRLFYLIYAVLPVCGIGASIVVLARAMVVWFDRRRGLALGLMLAGIGVGATINPLISQLLVQSVGWREAYLVLGGIILVIALPLNLLLLRESPADMALARDGDAQATSAVRKTFGLFPGEAVRTRAFWLLLAISFLSVAPVAGIYVHLVPMLADRGVAPLQAATVQSTIGVSLILGRIVTGWLLDRFHAPRVAVAVLCTALVGYALLLLPLPLAAVTVAAMLLGFAIGAEGDFLAYLASRYFGERSFSELYGWMAAVSALGGGTGPLFSAAIKDLTGEYTIAIATHAAILGSAIVAILLLGPYPEAGRGTHAPDASR
jgi:MFS family permease